MSLINHPLANTAIDTLQTVGLNSPLTKLILDADAGNSSITITTGSIKALYIDAYANVGINTSAPTAQLEIASDNGANIRLRYGQSVNAFADIFTTTEGNLTINPNTPNAMTTLTKNVNISNHNGTTAGLKLNGTLVVATAAQLNYTAVTPGVAAESKALVLDSSGAITGISSLNTALLYIDGVDISTVINLSVGYLNNVAEGIASPQKAIILNSAKGISGITSVGTTTLVLGGVTLGATEAGYLSSITTGTASASKALVLGASKNIGGVNQIGCGSLVINTASETYNPGTGDTTLSNMIMRVATGRNLAIDYASGDDLQLYWSDGLTNAVRAQIGHSGTFFSIGNFGIGYATVPSTYKLDVNGSVNASTYYLNGDALNLSGLPLITDITPGTASASQAVIVDANKDITGIRQVSLTGASDLLTLTNTDSSSYVQLSLASDTNTLKVGVRGSTNATTPNNAYWNFGGADRMLMNSDGDVAIGTSAFGYKLNVNGIINATAVYVNGAAVTGESIYTVGVTAGTVIANKAMVVDANNDITGLRTLGFANTVSTGFTGATYTNNSKTWTIGLNGTTAASNPGAIYWQESTVKMLLNSTGCLTIGTTDQTTYKLSVDGALCTNGSATFSSTKSTIMSTTAFTSTYETIVYNSNTTTGAFAGIAFLSDTGTTTTTTPTGSICGVRTGTYGVGDLVFSTKGTSSAGGACSERMRILSTGNVCIGKSTASYMLDVNGSVNSSSFYIGGVQFNPSYYTGITAGTGAASKALVLDASRNITNIGTITCGSLSVTTLYISNGTTTTISADTSGNITFNNNSSAIYRSGNSSYWDITSDMRIKTDIVPADLNICYNVVKHLPLKYYRYIDEVHETLGTNNVHTLGWIAQDLQKFFPKAVSVSEQYSLPDCLSINVDDINKAMYGAVSKIIEDKELTESKIDTLLQKNNTLEEEISALQTTLNNACEHIATQRAVLFDRLSALESKSNI